MAGIKTTLALAMICVLYIVLGSYCEANEIIVKPAAWALYGVFFGAIGTAIIVGVQK